MLLHSFPDSKSVAAAGFDAGVLRVLMRSGHWYDFAGRAESDLEALIVAPSRGRFVREQLFGRPATPAEAKQPLDTIVDDGCCSGRLSKALRRGELAGVDRWECPKCGVEWVWKPADPGRPELGRHWEPRTWAAIFR